MVYKILKKDFPLFNSIVQNLIFTDTMLLFVLRHVALYLWESDKEHSARVNQYRSNVKKLVEKILTPFPDECGSGHSIEKCSEADVSGQQQSTTTNPVRSKKHDADANFIAHSMVHFLPLRQVPQLSSTNTGQLK